mgnify:CR=1 FL=1
MAKKIKMIAKIKYNYSTHGKDSDIELDVDLSRFEKQYGKAQYALDSMIMTSMQPYMPHRTGTFINVTKAMSAAIAGSGTVIAAAPPMGRFLYEGKVMVDEKTGSPWARPGAKKVVTDRDLKYSNPKATPHWFDTAKENHGDSWVRAVKKIAGGG